LADSQNIIARPTREKDFAVPLADSANAANCTNQSDYADYPNAKLFSRYAPKCRATARTAL